MLSRAPWSHWLIGRARWRPRTLKSLKSLHDAITSQDICKQVWGTKTRVIGVPTPGVPRPGVPRPGVPRPGVPRPGVPRPGVPRPGIPRPGVPRPGVTRPGILRPGGTQIGGTQTRTRVHRSKHENILSLYIIIL